MKITVIEKNTVGDIIQERTVVVDYGDNKTYDGVNTLVAELFESLQDGEE